MDRPAKVCGQAPLPTASPSQEGTLGAWSLTYEQKPTWVQSSAQTLELSGLDSLSWGWRWGYVCAVGRAHLNLSATTTGERGWRAPPSCLRGHWLLLKAGISDPLPTPQGDRQQDVKTPGTQCSVHQPISAACTNGSISSAQPKAQSGVTRMQACARWGMCLAGLPGRGWKRVGKIQK